MNGLKYRGWLIEESITYPKPAFEAHKLDNCDLPMIISEKLIQVVQDIDDYMDEEG